MHLSNESLLVIIIVGIVAGWLAGQIVRGGGFGLIGGTTPGAGNLISWNLGSGISEGVASGGTIQGNKIGTDIGEKPRQGLDRGQIGQRIHEPVEMERAIIEAGLHEWAGIAGPSVGAARTAFPLEVSRKDTDPVGDTVPPGSVTVAVSA